MILTLELLGIGCLGYNTIKDIKTKTLSWLFIILMTLFGVMLRVTKGCLWSMDTLYVILPGIIFLVISFVTNEVIGYGDGIILIPIGLYSSVLEIWRIVLLTVFSAGIIALFLLTVVKKKKEYELPMVPFFLFYYILERWFI